MKQVFILTWLLVWSLTALAQKPAELLEQIKTAPDTIKVNLYRKLASKTGRQDIKQGIEYYKIGFALAQKLRDTTNLAMISHNLGVLHFKKGEYPEAARLFFLSLEFNQVLGESKNLASSYSSVGVIYAGASKPAEAMKHFKESLRLYEKLGDANGIVSTLNNIAGLYHLQKKYDEAIDFYLKNEIARKENGDSTSLMLIWANLGETYYKQEKYAKAKEYYTKLEVCAIKLKNEESLVTAKKGLAQVEEKLKKVVDDQTIEETQQALTLAKKQAAKDDVKELAVLLSSLYETQQKYSKALEYHKLAMSYKDSVISKESTSQMAKLMSKYQFTQQKRQIKKQAQTIQKKEQDLKSQRTITYLLVVVLAVMWVATYALFRFYKLRQQHAKSQLETKVAEGETRLLRAQMNPHFIFNSLNAIQSFIMMNNERMANRYLSRFSKLMRMFLESSRSQYTTISDEIELLDHYMELEKLRFEDKFDYEIEMDQALDAYNTEIPTMIIQPFIENAINHGFTHKKQKGMLKVGFRKDGDEISCTVEDNGIGRKKAAEFKQQSTKPQYVSRAMQIIEERLDLINTLENTNIGTTISDKVDQANESNGTKVEIRIPLWES